MKLHLRPYRGSGRHVHLDAQCSHNLDLVMSVHVGGPISNILGN